MLTVTMKYAYRRMQHNGKACMPLSAVGKPQYLLMDMCVQQAVNKNTDLSLFHSCFFCKEILCKQLNSASVQSKSKIIWQRNDNIHVYNPTTHQESDSAVNK